MWIERPPSWFRALFPGALFRIKSDADAKPAVFLTFDDGPIPQVTPWVLDTLDSFGIKATFFMVGQNVERYPDLFREIKRRGHAVGNHTLHHLKGIGKSVKEYLEDAGQGELLTESRLFRPPHGLLSPSQFKAVRKKGYDIVMYDLVTRDYSSKLSAKEVVDNVRKFVRDGSIIVFHDSLKSWPRLERALPEALEWLLNQGYEFKTLDSRNN